MRIRCLLPLLALALPLTVSAQSMSALIEELGLRESRLASRDMPGWSRPAGIAVLGNADAAPGEPGSQAWFEEATDGIAVTLIDGGGNFAEVGDSEVVVAWCNPRLIDAAENMRYFHILSAGIDRCTDVPDIAERGFVATNSQKAASETIAEHAIAMMLALTRNLHHFRSAQADSRWARDVSVPAQSVKGKTMLVLGLGGIGNQVAKRAHGLGMRVYGTRNSSRSGPDYVARVGLADETEMLAKEAHVVVNALPLTDATRGIVGASFFAAMPAGSYYVSVGRGGTTSTDALMAALTSGKLNGAGLDVTDPEPLPDDHALWQQPNVIISPHVAARSDLSRRNTMLIARENLRRYVRGEKLLNQVDLARGY